VPHGAKFREIWRFFHFFQNGGRRHLELLKFRNVKGRKGQEDQYASPCHISWRSIKPLLRYGDCSIFPRWRQSAILDLRFACLDHHPRRAFDGLYHCAKFGWNRYSSFDNLQVLIFCELGLNTSIYTPKFGCSPKRGEPGLHLTQCRLD